MTQARSPWLDRTAMSLSGLCLIHCLGGSLLLAILATTGGFMFSHQIHLIGLALAAPLAAVALWRGVRVHGRWLVAALGAAGICAMAAALFERHGQPVEIMTTVLGVSLLGAAHLYNLRSYA